MLLQCRSTVPTTRLLVLTLSTPVLTLLTPATLRKPYRVIDVVSVLHVLMKRDINMYKVTYSTDENIHQLKKTPCRIWG